MTNLPENRENLAVALREAYAPGLPKEVADKIFAKAWEDGHANGVHEVDMQYEELVQIAQAAIDTASGPQANGASDVNPSIRLDPDQYEELARWVEAAKDEVPVSVESMVSIAIDGFLEGLGTR